MSDTRPNAARKAVTARTGVVTAAAYRGLRRVRDRAFARFAGGAFAGFGRGSVIVLPVRLAGERRIAVGTDVYIGAGSWLRTGPGEGVALEIGDGTSIAGDCVLSAERSVHVGRRVLMARNVYIADHAHAFDDPSRPVLDQGVTDVAPVVIGDGAWLAQNVVVLPGVRIGAGAVVGANSVVRADVPDHAVAVGAPARVVHRDAAAGRTDT